MAFDSEHWSAPRRQQIRNLREVADKIAHVPRWRYDQNTPRDFFGLVKCAGGHLGVFHYETYHNNWADEAAERYGLGWSQTRELFGNTDQFNALARAPYDTPVTPARWAALARQLADQEERQLELKLITHSAVPGGLR